MGKRWDGATLCDIEAVTMRAVHSYLSSPCGDEPPKFAMTWPDMSLHEKIEAMLIVSTNIRGMRYDALRSCRPWLTIAVDRALRAEGFEVPNG